MKPQEVPNGSLSGTTKLSAASAKMTTPIPVEKTTIIEAMMLGRM